MESAKLIGRESPKESRVVRRRKAIERSCRGRSRRGRCQGEKKKGKERHANRVRGRRDDFTTLSKECCSPSRARARAVALRSPPPSFAPPPPRSRSHHASGSLSSLPLASGCLSPAPSPTRRVIVPLSSRPAVADATIAFAPAPFLLNAPSSVRLRLSARAWYSPV